jgi:two-component system sensor histidine kinase HydH
MREVAATGDLTRKIHRTGGWADADALLLASTFNTLTDSIARFQREISQKERLSSLGRMSTVVAHEIRNPLMIIKAALHTLKNPDASPASVREAVADIDDEVVRLNRIVNEVLDFARPIRFDLVATDLNALCSESAAAAEAGGPGPPIAVDLDPLVPRMMLDPERLRQALVNMLVNARHAFSGAAGPAQVERPPIVLRTRRSDRRVSVVVSDRGSGIAPADLPRVFDPYFTTKRGGSGLGLAIARNIVEGLTGTIAVTSQPGQGTEIRIEFCQPSVAEGRDPAPRPPARLPDLT